jgi:hypothetical protein
MAQRQNKVIPTLDHPLNDMKVRTVATETTTNNTPAPEDMSRLPKEYMEFSPIFAKPIAGQLPPHRPWDLKVRLIPNAPLSLSCHPYQLSRPEQIFQCQYIKENLARVLSENQRRHMPLPSSIKRRKTGPIDPFLTTENSMQ